MANAKFEKIVILIRNFISIIADIVTSPDPEPMADVALEIVQDIAVIVKAVKEKREDLNE